MKKVMMSVALFSAIAIAAGYSMIGFDKSDVNVSDLTSANVEALAGDTKEPDGCDPKEEALCKLGGVIWRDKIPVYGPSIN